MDDHSKDYDVESPPPNPPLPPQSGKGSSQDQEAGHAPASRAPEVPRPKDVQPLPLEEVEDDVPQSPRSVKELDVCPNCGASMRDMKSLVCLRCGFDLKTNRMLKTKIEKPREVEAKDEQAQGPLVIEGLGNMWLPASLAIASGVVLLIGYFAAVRALYPRVLEPQAHITAWMRIQSVLQEIVLVAILTGCGIAGLYFMANLISRQMGDLKLAAMRMLGIVATIRLAAFLDLPGLPWVELLLEAVVQAGAFIGLSMAFFRLKPRDAATLALASLIFAVALWLGAHAVAWSGGMT